MEEHVDWKDKTCQEVLDSVGEAYVHCGEQATMLIQHRGRSEGPYFMCTEHGTHNVDNRDAELLTRVPRVFTPRSSLIRAKGKYAHVLPTLPRLMGDDANYQAKVNALKAVMRAQPDFKMQATYLARQYKEMRGKVDEVKDELYAMNMHLIALQQMMADQYEAEGVDNVRVDGHPVSIWLEPYAQVTDKEAYRQWCLKDPDLARKMAITWQATNELVKRVLQNGDELPPGVEAFAATKIKLGSEA